MRILFVRLSSFGDIVFSLPAARALRSAPGVTLAWAVEEPMAPLVSGAPYVDTVLTTRTKQWRRSLHEPGTRREIREFLASARTFAPDLIVDAQGLFKSAWITFLVPARRKIGYGFRTATERVSCLTTNERVEAGSRRHVLDRALALAEHVTGRSGFDRTPDVSHLVTRPAPGVEAWWEVRERRPFALVQPFSSAPEKEWGAESVAAFARKTAAEGLETVIRWGPNEEERARAIVSASGGAASIAPPTGPDTTAALAARAALFVGADTGPTHLAAAAGTPTLALFGPTDPDVFGPVGSRVAVLRPGGQDYNRRGFALASLSADDVFNFARPLLR